MTSKKQRAIETADSGDIQRFWKFVNKTSGCWLWTGEVDHNGRAMFSVNSVCVLAARFSYSTFVAPIPERLLVLHTCDNVLCVNFEDHLFIGDHQANRLDCVMKKRTNSSGPHPGVRGIKNGQVKLNDELVRYIRYSCKTGTELSRELGVSKVAISRVRNCITWTHI
jgi:hypothetical protein